MSALLSFVGPKALFFSFLFQEADQHKCPRNTLGRNSPLYQWLQKSDNIIRRHSRSASGRESRLFLSNTGLPIKAFGDDEKLSGNRLITPVSIKFTFWVLPFHRHCRLDRPVSDLDQKFKYFWLAGYRKEAGLNIAFSHDSEDSNRLP